MFDILDRNTAPPFFSDKKKELVGLKYGEFSCYFNEGHRTIKHKLYNDASMHLKRTSAPFVYELVVSGTSNLDCFYDSHQVFNIQKSMELRVYRINMNQDVCLTWSSNDNNESFEFVCDRKVLDTDVEKFMSVAYECIYEDHYKSSRSFIVDEKMLLLYSPHAETKVCSEVLKAKPEIYGKFIPDDPVKESTFIRYVPFVGKEPVHGDHLSHFEAILYVYRPDVRDYITNGEVLVKVLESSPFTYHLEVYSSNVPPIYQTISSDMNPIFIHEEQAFCWNYFENERTYSFKVVLYEKEMFGTFKEFMTKSVFETSSKSSFARHKRQHQDYIINSFTNNMACLARKESDEEGSEDEIDHGSQKIQQNDSAVSLTYDDDYEYKKTSQAQDLFYTGPHKNSILSANKSFDLSFLVRGNRIGLFSQEYESRINFLRSIEDMQTLTSRKPIFPTTGILHDQVSSYLMCDVNLEDNMVYKLDLNRGHIVEEWKVKDECALVSICPSSQPPCMPSNEQTILGITASSLFRIDPRQQRVNKMSDFEYKKYSSRPEFSTVASSQSKYVAVGSKKGVIRIFSELNTVATITLPPIGEPVLGLDITPNGHYVIATCSNFLMLVHTLLHNQAITLRIRPEHVTLMNEKVSFKRAYFNTQNENNIICTTGSFVVIWNFKKICQGDLKSYKMQRLEAPIVSSACGPKRGIIVAYEDQISGITKDSLQ